MDKGGKDQLDSKS